MIWDWIYHIPITLPILQKDTLPLPTYLAGKGKEATLIVFILRQATNNWRVYWTDLAFGKQNLLDFILNVGVLKQYAQNMMTRMILRNKLQCALMLPWLSDTD